MVLPALVLLGCSGAPGSGALRVTVELEPGLTSRCAKVVARGTLERESGPVSLAGRTRFVVGVTQAGEQAEASLQALGFSDEACTVPTAPAERSALVSAAFAPGVVEVTLRLAPASASDGGVDGGAGDGGLDGGVDRDGDGFPAGVDCDDDDPNINPGAAELCFDSVDNDCNALVDCEDTAPCAGMTCSPTGRCEGAVCRAPSEVGLCADGVDNDGDFLVDCADLADCPQGSPCSDANACTLGDTCGAPGEGCVKASDRVCDAPPATQCFAQLGACLPDAGGACTYAVTSGSCSDGLACTVSDACLGDGGCVGTPTSCVTPPAGGCFQAAGQCQESLDGGCLYPPVAAGTGTCTDGDPCTTNDRCDGDGGCRGTAVTCTPPDECRQWAQTCQANGACDFTVRTGQSCGDGGWRCDPAGACVAPTPAFPYTPSNFTTGQLPAESPALTLNCNVNLNTAPEDGGVGWTTCGGGPPPPNFSVISVGGNPAVLFFVESLTINSGATLRATGARPAIFAVRNGVTVNGTLDLGSTPTFRAAGGQLSCGSGTGQNGGAGGTPSSGGGAGGGGFGEDGADGSDAEGGGAKGAKGTANGASSLTPLRGGCRGGHGGRFDSANADSSGRGGWGGGALQISSGATLTINTGGVITARGAGGGGGVAGERVGGGGGGSGGAILLEGVEVRVNAGASVTANGGAGGEGSGVSAAGATGANGSDTTTARATTAGVDCGANGGQGGARAGQPTTGGGIETGGCNSVSNKPGGGGGGGVGHVRFRATSGCTVSGSAVVSPAQTGSGTGCQ